MPAKLQKKRRYHDHRGDGGRFASRPQQVAIPPVEQQAWLAGATPGWWISDHLEELRHFVSWIYVGVHKIAQQWAQAKFCVYDDAQDSEYEKSFRRLPTRVQHLAKVCRRWRTKSHTPDTQAEQETPLDDHAAVDLMEHPNPYTSGAVFRYQVACQIRLTGGCFIWEVPNQFGEPEHLWVIPRGWARPMAPSGAFPQGFYQITPIFNTFTQGIVSPSLSNFQIPYEQMIAVGWPDPLYPGEFKSPLSACSQIIDIMEQMDTSTLASLVNSVKPSLVFNIDPRNGQTVTEDHIKMLMAQVESLKAGPHNAGKVLAMLGLTVMQLMNGPSDLDYVNGRDQARKNSLAIQGVSEIVAGALGAGSYSEAAVGAKTTIEFSVEPDLKMFGECLTHRWQGGFLTDTQRLELTAKAYNDPELSLQKSVQVTAGFAAGFVSTNEARASLDLPPLDDPMADIPAVLLQPMMPQVGQPEDGSMDGETDPYAVFDSDMVDTEDDMPDEESTGMKKPELQQAGGRKMLKRFHLNGYGRFPPAPPPVENGCT